MVGYYAIALSLVNLALQLPIQLTGNLVTYYSHRQATENGPVGPDVFTGVVRCFAYLTLPLCFGLAGISSSLVHLFFGDAYAPTEKIVAILAIGCTFGGAFAIVYAICVCTGSFQTAGRQYMHWCCGDAVRMSVGDPNLCRRRCRNCP